MSMDEPPRCGIPQGCDTTARYRVTSKAGLNSPRVFGARSRNLCHQHFRVYRVLAERYTIPYEFQPLANGYCAPDDW